MIPQIMPAPLPRIVSEACADVALATQAPQHLILWGALSAVSLASQHRVDVKLPIGAVRPTSLYLIAVAQSGERKSAVDRLFFKEFYVRDRKEVDSYQAAQKTWNATLSMWKTSRELIVKHFRSASSSSDSGLNEELLTILHKHESERPIKPVRSRTIVQDLTSTAFVDAVEGSGRSIGIITDEGHKFLNSDLALDSTLINRAWDGSTLSKSRGNGIETVAIEPRVGLGVMVQPEVLEDVLRRKGTEIRNSGFLPRCMLCAPLSTQGFRPAAVLDRQMSGLAAFNARISELLPEPNSSVNRFTIDFDSAATGLWFCISDEVEVSLRPGGRFHDLPEFANKALENVGRIAAALAFFSERGEVGYNDVLCAKQIVFFSLEYTRQLIADHESAAERRSAEKMFSYFMRECSRTHSSAQRRKHLLHAGPVRGQKGASAIALLVSSGRLCEVYDLRRICWLCLPSQPPPIYFDWNPQLTV